MMLYFGLTQRFSKSVNLMLAGLCLRHARFLSAALFANTVLFSSSALYSPTLLAAPSIEVQHPEVRAVPPGSDTTAAFMALHNHSQEDRLLISAESDLSQVTELHNHIMSEGVMRMRRLTRIELPAGQTVKLEPGGLHLMLIGLKETPAEGDTTQITLQLDNGETIEVLTPVKKIDAGMMSSMHQKKSGN